jgi:NADH-quinone oxidoreductase subunit N
MTEWTAPAIELAAAAPIGFVGIGAVVVLLAEVLLSRRSSFLGRPVTEVWIGTVLALVAALALALAVYTAGAAFASGQSLAFQEGLPGMRLDRFSAFAIALVAVGSFLTCWLSITYLAEVRINHGEYYALVLLSTAGMMLLVSATDLLSLFLGLELMSIPIYVLAGFDRRKLTSNESAMKYFLVGSFASALLLYGAALVYGVTGALDFGAVRAAFPPANPLGTIGLGLLVVGFAFKVSSVPFHQWTPDVYEGAPAAVTAYMSITVKVAAFAALLRLLLTAFADVSGLLENLFWGLSLATIVVGNVMAVIQSNLKRLLAYSSVAHAGYVLMGFAAGGAEAHTAVLFYLLAYLFMNLGAFAVLVSLATAGRDCERLSDVAGLARTHPGLAALLTLFLLSLAGIPGTVGFIGKFLVFKAAIDAQLVGLTLVAVLGSLVSVYYYLRVPVAMYMSEPDPDAPRRDTSTGEVLVLAVCAVAVLLLGIFPSQAPLLSALRPLEWARQSAALLH